MRRVLVLCGVLSGLTCALRADEVITLNGEWDLSCWPQPAVAVTSPDGMKAVTAVHMKARVPGNVETALEAEALAPDPMVGSNVYDLRRWEGHQWCYSRSFRAPRLSVGQRAVLHFGGIDCLADVWLNGTHVGQTRNMLIPHDFDVTDILRPGRENRVQVILRSSVLEESSHVLGMFSIGNFASSESMYLRKAPHTFGWDIMPRLVSAGLWRPVELRLQDAAGFRDIHFYTSHADPAHHTARLAADVQLRLPFAMLDRSRLVVTLRRPGKPDVRMEQIINTQSVRMETSIQDADLWWPRGLGEAALYDARVEIVDEQGEVRASECRKVGLRTISLEHTELNLPEAPGRFRFYVNGVPVFVHGTNWVPLDALHSRDTLHHKRCIDMACDLNCNMIRCWGGNVYEADRFYDLCDSAGILVWQDFSMACGFYPQRDDFARELEREVTSVVLRLRSHPCLALWAGNNEDDCVYVWSGGGRSFDPNRDRVSRELIPRLLYEFDLTRPYLPSSPYLGEAVYQRGFNESQLPEAHLWGPRGYYKAAYYKEARNPFVSEIGYHGCPNRETLQRMMSPECVYPWEKDFEWNEEWLTKSVRRYPTDGKAFARNNLMLDQIRHLFGNVPRDLDDFILASQSVQAEAMKYFVEKWRGRKFDDASGIIWWNLRDGWPLISDAIVDYYYGKKRAYWYLRNAQRDVCLFMNDAVEGGHPLMAANETQQDAEGQVTVSDIASGRTLYEGSFRVPANSKAQVALLPETDGQGVYLIIYRTGGNEYRNHYLYGNPPYDLRQYRRWIDKCEIVSDGKAPS